MQSSDWAFMDHRGQAGDYPHSRATAHAEAMLEGPWVAAERRAAAAEPGPRAQPGTAAGAMTCDDSAVASSRVLILSWEYPPLIEGGLARHVRKLSEGLVEQRIEVHVLTRGGESPPEEVMAGVHIHRVREPTRPSDLNEFVAWVERELRHARRRRRAGRPP